MADKPGETPKTEQVTETVTPTQNSEQAATPAATVEELQATVARLEAALKERNKEEAARRKKLEALEAAENERAQAALTETEKLAKAKADAEARAAAAEKRAIEIALTAEIRAQAALMGFVDPADAMALVDRSKVEMTDGGVTGVVDALKALASAKPYMLKRNVPTIGTTNPGDGASSARETDAERRRRLGI